MIAEGRGATSPRPVTIKLNGGELVYLEQLSKERKLHRAYSSFRSTWKNGVITDAVMVGMVGEYVVASYMESKKLRISNDMDQLNSGDGGIDFVFAGHKYQIKTRVSKRNRFVRRVTDRGMLEPIVCDRFIFCSFDSKSTCEIDGWCDTDVVLGSRFSRSPRGDWWNANIPDERLEPMSDLVLLMGMEVSDE